MARRSQLMRRRQFSSSTSAAYTRPSCAAIIAAAAVWRLFAYADTFGNTGAVALYAMLLLHVALYGRSLDERRSDFC